MTYRDVVKLIEGDGWYVHRQKGSHRQYRHPVKAGTTTVAYHHGGDKVPEGTLKSILKQAAIQS